MKIKNTLIAAAAMLLCTGVSAKAVTFADADLINTTVNPIVPFSGSFNINSPDGTSTFTVDPAYGPVFGGGSTYTSATGYDGEDITSGQIAFWFRNAASDIFNVIVDVETILSSTESGAFVFLGQSLNASLIASLETDGILTYTVLNAGPTDILFDYALLTVNAVDAPTGVADGGATLMLLGSALTGIGLLRRKLGLA